ncbi:unnamed protein product [Schistosoma curassoni]|uniref:Cation_ATPase_N domain-containing protein n=1 Tax=Schistosoma curassoni TaxID=6186 RepID=A0A183L0D7_9TREM|nr:unnamed protein product [Schistosoma curassoni]
MATEKKSKKNPKKDDLNELKQELDMDEHRISLDELYSRLSTDPQSGLTAEQAKTRLERDGPNALTPPKTTPEWVKFCKTLFGGFSLLLWIGAVLCFIAFSIESGTHEDPPKDNIYEIKLTDILASYRVLHNPISMVSIADHSSSSTDNYKGISLAYTLAFIVIRHSPGTWQHKTGETQAGFTPGY